jgi:hypothetical protein
MKVTVDWGVIKTEKVRAVDHSKLAGLQVADAVASGIFYAVNTNRYGNIEERYAQTLKNTFYRFKGGKAFGYGIKFWPEDMEEIKKGELSSSEFTLIITGPRFEDPTLNGLPLLPTTSTIPALTY